MSGARAPLTPTAPHSAGGRGFWGVPQQPAGRVGGKEGAGETGRTLAFLAAPARLTQRDACPEAILLPAHAEASPEGSPFASSRKVSKQ